MKTFSKLAAVLAIISILFLPVAGCGGRNVTGIDIIKEEQIEASIKIFLLLSIICGIIILFLKNYIPIAFLAIGGIVTLFISYFIAHDKLDRIELKVGAFIAIISYAANAVIGFVTKDEQKFLKRHSPSPSNFQQSAQRDSITEIENLSELRKKGILTEDEFNKKKTDLLKNI